jgi:hypothetical protein
MIQTALILLEPKAVDAEKACWGSIAMRLRTELAIGQVAGFEEQRAKLAFQFGIERWFSGGGDEPSGGDGRFGGYWMGRTRFDHDFSLSVQSGEREARRRQTKRLNPRAAGRLLIV